MYCRGRVWSPVCLSDTLLQFVVEVAQMSCLMFCSISCPMSHPKSYTMYNVMPVHFQCLMYSTGCGSKNPHEQNAEEYVKLSKNCHRNVACTQTQTFPRLHTHPKCWIATQLKRAQSLHPDKRQSSMKKFRCKDRKTRNRSDGGLDRFPMKTTFTNFL